MTEQLADHTTLRLGGPIGQLLTHTHRDDWPDIAQAVRAHDLPPLILGGGSNMITPDAGYPGPVVRIASRGIRARPFDDERVDLVVQAGEPLDRVVDYATEHGLSGIEYLAGIPGTIGAAPVQNTGAYGQEISDTLASITAYDWRLQAAVQIPASACGLTHRSSHFKTIGNWTILSVTLRLRRSTSAAPVTYQRLAEALGTSLGSQPPLATATTGVRADRTAHGLSIPPSGPDSRQVGSVFINPTITQAQAEHIKQHGGPIHQGDDGRPRASAGWLIEYVGHSPGSPIATGIHCSTKRALTLVARERATSATFEEALQRLRHTVRATTGVALDVEPQIIKGVPLA
nr:UDP-N-acetylmuramate dehydrogenase [Streptacidiphilus melanogenes]